MAGALAIAGDLLGTLLKAALAGLALVWALQRVLSTPQEPDSGDTVKKRQRKKKGSQSAAAGEGSTAPAAAGGPMAQAKGKKADAAAGPKPTAAAAATGPAAQAQGKKAQPAARPKPTAPIVLETESSSEEEDPAPKPKPIFPPRTASAPIEAGWEPVRATKKPAAARPGGTAQGAGIRTGSGSSKGGPVDTSKKRGEVRVCERPGCGAEGRGLRKCGRCGKVAYCTPACMQSDWERHQVSCDL